MTRCPYGFRILGPTSEPRRLVDAAAALAGYAACDGRAEVTKEAYLSAFTFGEDFRRLLLETGSTAGFSGPCWSPWLWFDVDNDDLHFAHKDASALAVFLVERYVVEPDELLVFFSGSKGFHVGLPTALWSPAPSADFHRTARRFAEHAAELATVTIDAGVYDRVRAFRAPNSRHPKTGLNKRRLSLDELTGLSLDAILNMAKETVPFDLPTPKRTNDQAATDWQAAVEQVAREAEAKAARRTAADGLPTLNRATFDFIREGAAVGDRHRLLFSAAANLAEFGCPPSLAFALLQEAALDSGLPPREVRRQIECGLAAATTTRRDAPESTEGSRDDNRAQAGQERDADDSGGSQRQSYPESTRLPHETQQEADVLHAALASLWNRAGPTPAPGAASPQLDWAPPEPARELPAPPRPGPMPPADAKLHFIDRNMRPCSPADCTCWTWEGGPKWFHASEYVIPTSMEGGQP